MSSLIKLIGVLALFAFGIGSTVRVFDVPVVAPTPITTSTSTSTSTYQPVDPSIVRSVEYAIKHPCRTGFDVYGNCIKPPPRTVTLASGQVVTGP